VLLNYEQGLIHKDYLLHPPKESVLYDGKAPILWGLFDLFITYCLTAPKTHSRVLKTRPGMEYGSVYFRTYSLPCFNELRDSSALFDRAIGRGLSAEDS